MLQALMYCTGGAFLSAAFAACAGVMVSAAANIAAAEPSSTPIILSPPEIFILRLQIVVREIRIRSGCLRPLLPYPLIGDVAIYSGLFILFLSPAVLVLGVLCLNRNAYLVPDRR